MENISFALPVSGALYDGSMDLLNKCDLSVSRSNNRVYTAKIPSLKGLDVMFQRQSDIPARLDSKVADIGIVGLANFSASLQISLNLSLSIAKTGIVFWKVLDDKEEEYLAEPLVGITWLGPAT